MGDLNLRVAAGVGGRMEWSLRCIRANSVIGMWQEMHSLPAVPALWCVWAGAFFTLFRVTGHAGVVGLLLLLEPVAAARGVAGDAVDLARLGTGAHAPGGVGVVLTQVAAIGVEVGVFQGRRGQSDRRSAHPAGTVAVSGDILAWQREHVALCCSGVNFLTLMILRSWGTVPLGASGRPCCAPPRGRGRSRS